MHNSASHPEPSPAVAASATPRQRYILLLKITVSTALLVVLAHRLDLISIARQLGQLPLGFVLVVLAFYAALQWLSCLRWQLVLETAGHYLRTPPLLSSYFAGMFLNMVLPGAVGGDAYRVFQLARHTRDSEAALVSVFLERFTGLAALSALSLMGLVPALQLIERWDLVLICVGSVAALVGGVMLSVSPRLLHLALPLLRRLRLAALGDRLAKIQQLLRQFAGDAKALFWAIGLSLGLQLAIVYYHFVVAQQLNLGISYLELLVFIPIVVVITLLPISLGGLGLKEGLWIYLLGQVGVPAEQALLFSLTITVLSWALSLPGAIILGVGALRSHRPATADGKPA